MKKTMVIAIMVMVSVGFRQVNRRIDPSDIKAAVNKSLPVLQSSSHTFLVNAGGCHSCHGQGLGAVTFSLAHEAGINIIDSVEREATDSIYHGWQSRLPYLAQHDDPSAIVIGGGYDLWALSATGYPRDRLLELLAQNIFYRQRKDGSWVSPNERPPLEYYAFSATALSIKGIQAYLPDIFQDEMRQRLGRARNWLMTTPPIANEEKVFQLLGLLWAGGDKEFIRKQALKLCAAQHADGGWSQLNSLSSDAYATGQSLYALQQCGQDISSVSFQKGIQFLLKTQEADGSWRIKTRSFPSVPYVYSGFPHGEDQFISAAGTNWATMALLASLR